MSITNTLEKRFDSFERKIDGLDKKFDGLISMTKTEFAAVREEIESLAISTKKGFDEINERMVTKEHFDDVVSGVNRRLDIIKNISVGGHERRIENLEDRVRVVETKTGLRRK